MVLGAARATSAPGLGLAPFHSSTEVALVVVLRKRPRLDVVLVHKDAAPMRELLRQIPETYCLGRQAARHVEFQALLIILTLNGLRSRTRTHRRTRRPTHGPPHTPQTRAHADCGQRRVWGYGGLKPLEMGSGSLTPTGKPGRQRTTLLLLERVAACGHGYADAACVNDCGDATMMCGHGCGRK